MRHNGPVSMHPVASAGVCLRAKVSEISASVRAKWLRKDFTFALITCEEASELPAVEASSERRAAADGFPRLWKTQKSRRRDHGFLPKHPYSRLLIAVNSMGQNFRH